MTTDTKTILTITDAARKHFQSKINERADGWGIYIGVRNAGCSGLSYVIEYWDGISCNNHTDTGERPHTINEIHVVIHPKHEVYFHGMEIDFVKEGLNEGLKFNNPNMTSECGCGETFTIT